MKTQINLKKGDTVAVLQGKDKGKTGKIIEVNRTRNTIVVEGLNIHHRFEKPKSGGGAGTKISFPSGMPTGKIQLICPNCGKASRIGYSFLENGTKQRICKKCGKAI